mgnify:FL=1
MCYPALRLLLFWVMLPDNLFFKEKPAESLLSHLGWKLVRPRLFNDLIIFKPDFYTDGHVILYSHKGHAYCAGSTIVEYNGKVYHSVSKLIEDNGKESIEDYNSWKFIQEKEWVITRTGSNTFLHSFTGIEGVPTSAKYRC